MEETRPTLGEVLQKMAENLAAVSSHLCTETFIKIAKRSGVSKEEIGEAIITARFALASTVFASATEGLDFLTEET